MKMKKWAGLMVVLLAGAALSCSSGGSGGGIFLTQSAKLVSSDLQVEDVFGTCVDVDGDYIVVGAPGEDGPGDTRSNGGAAYIFHRTGPETWDSGVKLTATDASSDDGYGGACAISGDYVVVGAGIADGPESATGAVYVHRRTGTNTWDAGVKLTGPDSESGDGFGASSVDIDGDYIVVGALWEGTGISANNGAAYVFRRTGTNTWTSGIRLDPGDGGASYYIGVSVSISGDYVIVGAPGASKGLTAGTGAAYVFRRTGSDAWDDEFKVTASDAESGDSFGGGVAIEGNRILIGANSALPPGSAVGVGTVYFYSRTATNTWGGEVLRRRPVPDIEIFGTRVALSDTFALINYSVDPEQVFVYSAGGGYLGSVAGDDITTSDKFGFALSTDGETIVVGAPEHAGAGAVYVFE